MADKPWKHAERRVAKLIGGERIPVSGRARGDQPDIKHNYLSPEVKYRAKLPAWIHKAFCQAEASARGNQTPVVVLMQKNQKAEDAVVMFRLGEFTKRFMPEMDDG